MIPNRRQQGFTLIEMIVVLIVMGVIIGVVARGISTYDKTRRAIAYGGQIDMVASALENYGTRYRGLLVNGQPVTGYTNPNAPTIAELRADPVASLLPPNFNATPLVGGNYVTAVTVTPVGCAPNDCDLQYVVYGSQALVGAGGQPDIPFAASAAAAIQGGRGGYTDATTLRGIGDAWNIPNPSGTDAGLVGALASYRTGLLAQFLRVDGTNQMAADLQMANNNIRNAGIVQAGRVTLTGLAVAGDACAVPNQLAGSASGDPMVCIGSVWRRLGWRYASAGGGCTGTEIASDGAGQALVCRSGTFVALADRLPRVVDVAQTVVGNGAAVAQPTCSTGGTPSIAILPLDPGVDFTRTPAPNRVRASVVASGSNWVVSLGLVDQNGTVWTSDAGGALYGLQAIARTTCVYSS